MFQLGPGDSTSRLATDSAATSSREWGSVSVAGWAWWSATASMNVSGNRQAEKTRAAASSWAMP